MKTIELIKEITDFLDEIKVSECKSVADYVTVDQAFIKELKETDNVFDYIWGIVTDKQGFEEEIIYYQNAIEYLQKYDNSLRDSLEIASEYGYTFDNLNSEILASLLATRKNEEAFTEKETKINEFFEELFK